MNNNKLKIQIPAIEDSRQLSKMDTQDVPLKDFRQIAVLTIDGMECGDPRQLKNYIAAGIDPYEGCDPSKAAITIKKMDNEA